METQQIEKSKKKWYKKKKSWAIIIGGIFILIIVIALISDKGMPIFKNIPNKVNQSAVALTGWHVESGSNVKVYLNGDVAMETQADSNGEFKVELNLNEGKNTLYAVATYKGKLVKGAEENITYINQEKIDAQNKTEADARTSAQEAEVQATSQPQEQVQQSNEEPKAEEPKEKIVTRNEIITLFPEFKFTKGNPVDGKENYIGKSIDSLSVIQLIGLANKLSEISITIFMSPKDIGSLEKINGYKIRMIKKLTPSLLDYYIIQVIHDGDKKTADWFDVEYKYASWGSGTGTYSESLIFTPIN